jgi:hypothetical protein
LYRIIIINFIVSNREIPITVAAVQAPNWLSRGSNLEPFSFWADALSTNLTRLKTRTYMAFSLLEHPSHTQTHTHTHTRTHTHTQPRVFNIFNLSFKRANHITFHIITSKHISALSFQFIQKSMRYLMDFWFSSVHEPLPDQKSRQHNFRGFHIHVSLELYHSL